MIHEGDFLGGIIARLRQRPTDEWQHLTLLLPGRRAARKLADALAKETAPGTWLPRFTTLGEWSGEQLRLTTPSKLELLVELQQVAEANRDRLTLPEWTSFERFQPWGLAALGDFNAIDHHLLEARQVFRDLRNIKDIESWSFGEPDLRPGQLRFLEQWNSLLPLYQAFHTALAEQHATTTAHLIRRMAEDDGWLGHVRGEVWMAGANAMTPAERRTVERLLRAGKGQWIWDTDVSYVRSGMEAGRFVREVVPQAEWHGLPHPLQDATQAGSASRNWRMVTCSSRTLQAQYVRHMLEKSTGRSLDRVGIILPSADLAPTVLTSLPPEAGQVNLTMGVPLDKTPLRSFLSLALGLQGDRGRLHHNRLKALLAHPFTRALQPDAAAELETLGRTAARKTWIRMTEDDLTDFPAIRHALSPWWLARDRAKVHRDDGTSVMLEALASWSSDAQQDLHDPWLSAAWAGFRDIVALHLRSVDRLGREQELADVRAQLMRWMGQHAVDLEGEPFTGLQVLGLLESRALDFDEVFVLDVNEGILPDGSPPPTFMPLDLQRAHGLPGRPERDGIFAAYLHRLLHRARTVHLVHVGSELGDGGTEPSRHIAQLSRWASETLPGVSLKVQNWSTLLPSPAPKVPDLEWTDLATRSLDHMMANGISPSALNQALRCNRQFHYRYVYGFGEAQSVEEHLEANTIGTVIHKAVELGLKTAVGQNLLPAHLQQLAKDIRPRLEEALHMTKEGARTDIGENVLVLRMAATMVGRWIREELAEWKQDESVHLVGMEADLRRTFTLANGQNLSFYGVADRVERRERNGHVVWQVLDYKTGRVEGKDLKLGEDWQEKLSDGSHDKALQLLLYAAMLRAQHPQAEKIRPAIRAGRKGEKDTSSLLTLSWEGESELSPDHDLKIQAWLSSIIHVLRPDQHGESVQHNPDCRYCADCLVLE